jgi:probable addiction module antidote protein
MLLHQTEPQVLGLNNGVLHNFLLTLRFIAEAYGGLGAVAAEVGISRESLYRALSPKGNPTLKTLLAVLKAVGMKLSVEPENQVAA